MKKSIVSEVVKETIRQEAMVSESLYSTFKQAIDTVKGTVIGGLGGGFIAGGGAMLITPFVWALGLTNPLTALGITIAGVAKLGMAAGMAYGAYVGSTGQLGEFGELSESVVIEESMKDFASLSDRAVKAAKDRDALIEQAHGVLKSSGDIPSDYDNRLKRLTDNMKRAFSDVKRYVTQNRNMFKREDLNNILKICDLGISGKLTYLKDKK